jgi:hypothetical protein
VVPRGGAGDARRRGERPLGLVTTATWFHAEARGMRGGAENYYSDGKDVVIVGGEEQ